MNFLNVLKAPTSDLLELLNNNVIGTPGYGMLYQHCGVDNKIHKIENPYYVVLKRNNTVTGTCCFCKRTTINTGTDILAYYVRYFSFRDSFRRKQVIEKQVSRHSLLREEIRNILAGAALDVKKHEKFYHYAYVDPRNVRSATLCKEFGFEAVRQYTTIIFNRVSPQADSRSSLIEVLPPEVNVVKELLKDFYKDYNMFSFENLFNGRRYFVLKDHDQRIMAGVQVNPEHWKVLSLPGLSGRIILNVFSKLPFLNKLFNKDYRFLTLEGIYYAPGCENSLSTLFENLLTRYRLNSVVMVVDADTPLYRALKSLNLGLVDKLNKEVRGEVICRFNQFSETEKENFRTRPAYISGIDVT